MPCAMRRAGFAALLVAIAAPAPAQAHRAAVPGPARGEVTLAQIRYAVPHGRRPAMRLAIAGPTGSDYVVAALPRRQPRRAVVALVAVVNRSTRGALVPDVAQIVLRTRPSRPLAAPSTSVAMNVLAAKQATRPPACALGPLAIGDLRLALHAGAPAPPGFGARATIAQALAAACGRPVAPAFRAAIVPPEPPPRACPPPCRPIEPIATIVCPLTPPPGLCPLPA
jgi:hypothetical protein